MTTETEAHDMLEQVKRRDAERLANETSEEREERLDQEAAEASAEAEIRMWELSDEPSTWAVTTPEQNRRILRGETVQTLPTVFRRDDGQPLLYRNRINVFMGEPEGCKTFAALVAVAQEIRAGNVAMLVDLEDSNETANERLQQLGLSEDEIAEQFIYCRPESQFDEVAMARLQVAVIERTFGTDRQFTLAVVDSMTEVMAIQGLDPDRGTDVARLYHSVGEFLTGLGSSVVIIDHVIKSTDGRGRWAIGSERKLSGLNGAAYNFTAEVPFGRGRSGRVKVTVAKDRPGYIRQQAAGTSKTPVIGTLSLISDPITSNVDYRFEAPSASAALDDAVTIRNRIRADFERGLTEHPGDYNREELLATVEGNTATKRNVLDGMLAEGTAHWERGANRRQFYFPGPSPTP